MREGIHPKYDASNVSCICGETFDTRSTAGNIRVEVCSKCHPFYTGQRQQKISSGGRIERFMKKYGQEGK